MGRDEGLVGGEIGCRRSSPCIRVVLSLVPAARRCGSACEDISTLDLIGVAISCVALVSCCVLLFGMRANETVNVLNSDLEHSGHSISGAVRSCRRRRIGEASHFKRDLVEVSCNNLRGVGW